MTILKVIPIGNSKGVIIPNNILKKLNSDRLEVLEQESNYILKSAKPVREGWKEEAIQAHLNGDDSVLMDFNNKFDDNEWIW